MITNKLVGSIVLSTSVTMGAVQAKNITTRDDLFAYLQIQEVSSIASAKMQKCKYQKNRVSNTASMGDAQIDNITTRDDSFDL